MVAIVVPSAIARSQRASLSEMGSGSSLPQRSASWRAIGHGRSVVPPSAAWMTATMCSVGASRPTAPATPSRHEGDQRGPAFLAVDREHDGIRDVHGLLHGGELFDDEAALRECGAKT